MKILSDHSLLLLQSLLNTMYDVPRLETCQALLLLAHSEVSLSRLDSSYMYLGMAGEL